MRLRLTDGSQYNLTDCRQECDPNTGEDILVCILSPEYDFNEIKDNLKKVDIAELISVLDTEGFIFQSHDYKKVDLIVNDIKTNSITIKFKNQ